MNEMTRRRKQVMAILVIAAAELASFRVFRRDAQSLQRSVYSALWRVAPKPADIEIPNRFRN
jgi:hypothetical protein